MVSFLAALKGIERPTKREKPPTQSCNRLSDKSRPDEPDWDGKEPWLEEATCESWSAYLEKLRAVGSWGGRLEAHAVAQL